MVGGVRGLRTVTGGSLEEGRVLPLIEPFFLVDVVVIHVVVNTVSGVSMVVMMAGRSKKWNI